MISREQLQEYIRNNNVTDITESFFNNQISTSDYTLVLRWASLTGNIDVINRLLDYKELDPSLSDNYAIRMAAKNGYTEVVKRLLLDKRVDPSSKNNFALQVSSNSGLIDIINILLTDERVDPSANNNYAINAASQHGHIETVNRLLGDKRVDPSANNNYCIRIAAKNGHLDVVDRLLAHDKVDPSADNNYAIRLAAENGHSDILNRFLDDERIDPYDILKVAAENGLLIVINKVLNDSRVTPDASDNYAIRAASKNGHLDVVDRLLSDLRVSPDANDNDAIIMASRNGHVNIVNRLLDDHRVKPNTRSNSAFLMAARNGHLNVASRLLSDERVNPGEYNNYAITMAAANGHFGVVDRLLSDSRVNPAASQNGTIRLAAINGHLNVVNRLLSDTRVDPRANNNDAIGGSAENGHLGVVNRLLSDSRVNPGGNNNYALIMAAANGHIEIVDRLLDDERVNPGDRDNDAIRLAAENGHTSVVNRLLADTRVNPSANDNAAIVNSVNNGHFAIASVIAEDPRVNTESLPINIRLTLGLPVNVGPQISIQSQASASVSQAMQNNENTMSGIIFHTAQKSERTLREVIGFPVATANSDAEATLITELIKELELKRYDLVQSGEVQIVAISGSGSGEAIKYIPYQHDLNIAIDALKGIRMRDGAESGLYQSYFCNNNSLSFTEISGYGMRNITALYYKAICDTRRLRQGVTREDGINSIVRAIANSCRGNNRNNESGTDDGHVTDRPICGKGHYNKIAEELSSILVDVNVIFDVTSKTQDVVKETIAREINQFCYCKGYKEIEIIKYWNTGTGSKPPGYDDFLKYAVSSIRKIIVNSLQDEFPSNSDIYELIINDLDRQISMLGGIEGYLDNIEIPESLYTKSSATDQPLTLTSQRSNEMQAETLRAAASSSATDGVATPGNAEATIDDNVAATTENVETTFTSRQCYSRPSMRTTR